MKQHITFQKHLIFKLTINRTSNLTYLEVDFLQYWSSVSQSLWYGCTPTSFRFPWRWHISSMATSWRQLLDLVLCYIQIPGQIKERFALNKWFNSSSVLMDSVLKESTEKMWGHISDILEISVSPSSKWSDYPVVSVVTYYISWPVRVIPIDMMSNRRT